MILQFRSSTRCPVGLGAVVAQVGALILVGLLAACITPGTPPAAPAALKIMAAENFLADLAQNVGRGRVVVETLIPAGSEPHTFEPTPQDAARIAASDILIVNGAGLETGWLEKMLENIGGHGLVIEAAAGLPGRRFGTGAEVDPHFWLDPRLTVKYVENIRDGLSRADPAGAEIYSRQAAEYIAQLNELDAWIETEVGRIPPERRLIVTNHESLGYFADRYGFTVVGTIVPSVSANAEPSAQELAQLIEAIRATGAPAIFLETGANSKLAEQVARDTGIAVITELYTHSLSTPDGPASTYIDMLKYNATTIVNALRLP